MYGYAHISNLQDNLSKKVLTHPEKSFSIGKEYKARVIGFRPLEALLLLSLK